MKLLIVGCALLTISCASNKTKTSIKEKNSQAEWIYSPTSSCAPNKELCASGEGESISESDVNARKSLASIFKSKINYRFQIDKSLSTEDEISQIKETVTSQVQEEVAKMLSGSYIKERAEQNNIFYSLAAIDVSKSIQMLKAKIKTQDDLLIHYLKLRNKVYIPKMLTAYHTRENLSEELAVLSGQHLKSPISLVQIKLIKYRSESEDGISISSNDELPNFLIEKFKALLTDLNYKIQPRKKADFNIEISYEEDENYLNVEGFKKMSFKLSSIVTNEKGQRIGGYSVQVKTQGRTKADCVEKMEKKMITLFQENIDKLNLKN